MPRHRLTNVVVSEVSGVDIPANQHARVVLMKSAGDAIEGVSEIRKSLEDQGAEALAKFDAGMQQAGDDMAVLLTAADPEIDEDLSRMAHAFGESVSRIYETAEGEERDGHLAETVAQFTAAVANRADAVRETIGKAAPPAFAPAARGGKPKTFKPCADCPDEGACTKAKSCATESKARAVEKAADDGEADRLAALAATGEALTKAAASFAQINTDREQRRQLLDMTYTLQDSLSSITSDPDVTDKLGMVRQSVAEFDAAVAALMGGEDEGAEEELDPDGAPSVQKAATGGSDPAHSEGNPMTQQTPAAGGTQDLIKSLTDRLAEVEKGNREAAAFAKARDMLPNGGPVADLAGFLVGATPEQATQLENVVKALVAQNQSADLFKAFGAAAGGEGDTVVESGVVKLAKAQRAEFEARRGRRVA
jgi:hypothetical protein